MSQARKILLADPSASAIRGLSKALRARGYHVHHAVDGTRALEVSVLRHPDVILFDESCAYITPQAFAAILASNPRTADIPVVITTTSRGEYEFPQLKEGVIHKPFNLDEVVARIDHLCRRAVAAQELRGAAREIEGGLSQLPLADLLQILAMNRRTGRLLLEHGRERGEIQLALGAPVNARLGDIQGEKALFRLICWKEGAFSFHPGPASERKSIERSMEDALLEGMRQSDERERLLKSLPSSTQALALVPDGGELIDPHPVTREILRVLTQPRKMSELLDLAQAADLDVLGALTTLLEKGVVQAQDPLLPDSAPILNTAEVHALRAKILLGRVYRSTSVAKIVICGQGPKAGPWFLGSLPNFKASSPDPACVRSSFGTLGTLDVNEALKLDFVFVPTAEAARPLWRPFLSSAIGALILEEGDAVARLSAFCAAELRLPLVWATGAASGGLNQGEQLPPALRGAPGGTAVVNTSIAGAVRTLLLGAIDTPKPTSSHLKGEH